MEPLWLYEPSYYEMNLKSRVMGGRNSYIPLDKMGHSALRELLLRIVVVAISWILQLFENLNSAARA